MTTAEERISRLEAQIDKLEGEQRRLREKLTEAQVEQWQGRIEDVEVQSHLAALEAQDRLGPLREDLRNQWLDVKTQLGHSKDTAADVIDTVRDSVESAIKALRDAVLDTRKDAAD
jgi:chromosome segregation ATPase